MSRFERIIATFCLLIILPSVALADGGRLYVSPSVGSYTIGQTFTAQVLADTGGTSMNAAEAQIQFDPASLSVERLSTDGSLFGSWPSAPTFSNASGTIAFTGWARQPYNGGSGLLLSIVFKALRSSDASTRFAAGAILAANGGSNIISSMQSALYTIRPAEIAPTSSDAIYTPPPVYSADVATATADTRTTSAVNPAFKEPDRNISVGDPIILHGIASPDATLEISYQEGDGPVVNTTITAGADGTFTFVSNDTATAGVYRVWVSEMGGGIEGMPSKAVTITAQNTALAAEVSLASGLALYLFPYVALFSVIGLGAGYLTHRHSIEKIRNRGQ